jgi:ubiquinone/menaquinone biosynthesis C-methylase UbiE
MRSFAEALCTYDPIESRLTAPISERMLDLASLSPGMRVLDLASGCGEPCLRAARRVGPHGSVLGLDISEALLAFAREKARHAAISNLELCVANAESPEALENQSFDAATARWGLMGMRSPARAVSNVRRALEPGAPFVAALWAEPERVQWAMLPRRVLARHRDVPWLSPEEPGPFRYAELSCIVRDFTRAGFTLEHVEEIEIPVIEAETGVGIAAWARDLILGQLAHELPSATRARFESDLAREVEPLRAQGVIRLGGVTRIVVGRAR